MSEPYIIYIASDLGIEKLASLLTDIFQTKTPNHIIFEDKDEAYYYDYLDHQLTLRTNTVIFDIEEEGLIFSKYNYELQVYCFDSSPPPPEYFEMSEEERYAYQDKHSRERRNKLERMSRFIFENLKETNQFSMMLTYYVEEKLDEYVVSKPSE